MLVRLTRPKRLMAGWLLALIYLLCVLAPGISFAFADGARAAHCLTDENHGLGIVHVHDQSESREQHVQKDGHLHEHFSQSKNHDDVTLATNETPAPANDPHKTAGQCCGLVCLSALPATVTDIIKPSALASVSFPEVYRTAVGKSPAGLYRPPIS